MALNNPHVQIVRLDRVGEDPMFFIYSTTYFERSDYISDVVESVSGPSGGKLTVTVKVQKSGTALLLNKCVYHQVDITDIGLSGVSEVEVIVKEGSTVLASRTVPHQSDSETRVRPVFEEWIG